MFQSEVQSFIKWFLIRLTDRYEFIAFPLSFKVNLLLITISKAFINRNGRISCLLLRVDGMNIDNKSSRD